VSLAASGGFSRARYSVNEEPILPPGRRKFDGFSWLVIGLRTDESRDTDGVSVENRCEAARLTSLFGPKRDEGRDDCCESLGAVDEPRRRYEGVSFRIWFIGDSGRRLNDELKSTEDIVDKRFIHDGLECRVSRELRSRDDFADALELSTSVPTCLCALPSIIVCLRILWEPLRLSRLGRPRARCEASTPRE
jgi:hypothetical protein